jgi:hypothetical protein
MHYDVYHQWLCRCSLDSLAAGPVRLMPAIQAATTRAQPASLRPGDKHGSVGATAQDGQLVNYLRSLLADAQRQAIVFLAVARQRLQW